MKKVCLVHTVASRLSTHGCVRDFGLHGHLPRIIISIHFYGSCYFYPLKFGTWALTGEWLLAQDTTVVHACMLDPGCGLSTHS